jgi:hypothetical protein
MRSFWLVMLALAATIDTRSSLAHLGHAGPLASAQCDAGPAVAVAKELDDALKAASRVAWWAATPEQIRAAPCTRPSPLTTAELMESLDQWSATESGRESRTIHGIAFEDENPKLLAIFENLTTKRDFIGRDLPENEQQQRSSSCKKVMCALKEIFGDQKALRLSYLSARQGINASHLTLRADDPPPGRAFSSAQLDDLILSVSDFPESLTPLRESTSGERRDVSIRLSPNVQSGAFANARVTLFESWAAQPIEERRSTLFHELGHRMGSFGGIENTDAWWRLTGWTPPAGKTRETGWLDATAAHPEKCVSEYACANPAEDFAESVVAYRYNPQGLQRVSPEKYAFLKATVFDGVEYLNSSTCSQPSRGNLETRAKAAREAVLLEASAVQHQTDEIFKSCGYWIARAFSNPSSGTPIPVYAPTSDGQRCIQQDLRIQWELRWKALHFQAPLPAEETTGLSEELRAVRSAFITDYAGKSHDTPVPASVTRAVEAQIRQRLRTEVHQAVVAFDATQNALRQQRKRSFRHPAHDVPLSASEYCTQWKQAFANANVLIPSVDQDRPGLTSSLLSTTTVQIAEQACLASQTQTRELSPVDPAALERILQTAVSSP